jgi:hypothetical protein
MVRDYVTELAELSDEELDMVAAGAGLHLGQLVSINVPVQINLGLQFANQTNVSVFSIAQQGGSQNLNLSALNLILP